MPRMADVAARAGRLAPDRLPGAQRHAGGPAGDPRPGDGRRRGAEVPPQLRGQAAGLGAAPARSAWSPGAPASSGRPTCCSRWRPRPARPEYRLATVNIAVDVAARRCARPSTSCSSSVVEALVVIVPHESVLREAHSLGPRHPGRGGRGRPVRDAADRRCRQRPGRPPRHRAPALARPRDRRAPVRPDGVGGVARPARRVARRAGGAGPAGPAAALGRRLERRAAATSPAASLAREADVTAVFVANDQMALGLIRALHEAGRRVPEDVSVVGFDDLPEARVLPAAAHHGPAGLRGARPPGDGHPRAGARRRGAADGRPGADHPGGPRVDGPACPRRAGLNAHGGHEIRSRRKFFRPRSLTADVCRRTHSFNVNAHMSVHITLEESP